jgi:hypothetical protein
MSNSVLLIPSFLPTLSRPLTHSLHLHAVAITTGSLLARHVCGQTTSCAAVSADAFFRVVAGAPTYTCNNPTIDSQGTCFTTLNGSCFTDGAGDYGNNERCTVSVLQSGYLTVSGTFDVECVGSAGGCYDYFTINSSTTKLGASTSLEGVFLPAGTTVNWLSDGSTVRSGWTLCGSVSYCVVEAKRAHAYVFS